jgi:hypothetical protein
MNVPTPVSLLTALLMMTLVVAPLGASACAEESPFALSQYRWQHRELVTLLDNGVSTAGRHELAKADVASAREALRIRPGSFALRLVGKDGGVKLSRDTATPVQEIYALIDTMPMRRRELSERQ